MVDALDAERLAAALRQMRAATAAAVAALPPHARALETMIAGA